MDWRDMSTAPRDGTWVLAMNNRGNCAVIIWREDAPNWRGKRSPAWVHPFTSLEASDFWNGGCGSYPVLWCPLPTREEKEKLIGDDGERQRLTRIETDTRAHYAHSDGGER